MSYNAEIEEIRSLLSKYYEGATTVDEERRLITLFAQVGRDNLPEDLTADWVMFSGLEVMDRIDSTVEVPAELAESIEGYAVVEGAEHHKRTLWAGVKRFVAYAAVAAVFAGVIFTTVRMSQNSNLPVNVSSNIASSMPHNTDTTRHTVAGLADGSSTAAVDNSNADTEQVMVAAVHQEAGTSHRKKVNVRSYRTVTDVDEAIAITRRCTELLARGGNESNRVLEAVDTHVDQVYQIINKI